MVPYFVVRRKGLTLNGANPTLLTAYGGFPDLQHSGVQRHNRQVMAGARGRFRAGAISVAGRDLDLAVA